MSQYQILDFVPAQVSAGKIIRVYFYAFHPQHKKLKRVVVKCNRIKSKSLNLQFAKKMAFEINVKLSKGWNPFLEQESSKGFILLTQAAQTFLNEKLRENRKDSNRSYTSFIKTFVGWLEQNRSSNYYVVSFTKNDAIDYLDYIYNSNKVSARTWNNYKNFMQTFFNWLKEHQYCKVNVFEGIKSKKISDKKRIIIDRATRSRIIAYCEANNLPLLIFIQIIYSCLLRPKEILYTQAKHFDLKNQYIYVPSEVAKNGHSRRATIPDPLLALMLRAGFDKINPEYYPFSVNMQPGTKRIDVRYIDKIWDKLRKDLHLPQEMQLYSFRDTGITDSLNCGLPANMVKEHADHSSLEMTTIYAKHNNPLLHEKLKKELPEF